MRHGHVGGHGRAARARTAGVRRYVAPRERRGESVHRVVNGRAQRFARSARPRNGVRDWGGNAALRPTRSVPRRSGTRVTQRRPDAIVVGAGIVGAACAVALARDGLSVLVVDASAAALGTTAAGMGHLVVMDDSPEQLALTKYSTDLWRAQASELRAAAELEWCGSVWVAEDDSQLEAVRAKQRTYAHLGIASEILGETELLEAEPNLRSGLVGGLLVPSDGVIYPPSATLALLKLARELGVELIENSAVDEIVPHGVRCGLDTLRADVVVNAAGAAASVLTP